MLGELIGEEQGQVTSTRVLEANAASGPVLEVSFQNSGHHLGVAEVDMGTYITTPRPDGTVHGDGKGCIITTTGETVTWQAFGLGRPNSDGSVSWRGSIEYFTHTATLAQLNSTIGAFEFEVQPDGKATAKIYAWL
jgi:hypothetical protein